MPTTAPQSTKQNTEVTPSTDAAEVSAGHGKLYFHNLDGLRFIAAFLVILSHCSTFRYALDAKLSNAWFPMYAGVGELGVKIFFVLSGFLITFLLLRERENTGRISVRSFYVRRVLRIWPLYFAVGLAGTILGPLLLARLGMGDDSRYIGLNLLFLLGFAVNLQNIWFFNRGIMEILWSVCVEEQFYLVWPWLVRWARDRWPGVLIACFALGLGSKVLLLAAFEPSKLRSDLIYYLPICKFDFFAAGGLAAAFWFWRERFSALIPLQKAPLQIAIVALNLLIVLGVAKMPHAALLWADGLVYGWAFALLILVLVSPTCPPWLETPIVRTAGRVSYGLYVFHPVIVQVLLRILNRRLPNTFWAWEIVFPLLVTLVTFAVAWLSYHLLEKHFLRLKLRFSAERPVAA